MLKLAFISFDHFNTDAHDATVQAGAIDVLVKCLQKAVDSEHGANEAEKLCKLIRVLLRCSEETATTTICSNMTEIVTLIIRIVTSTCTMEPTDKCSSEAMRLWMRMCISEIILKAITAQDKLLLSIMRTIRSGPLFGMSVHLSALKFVVALASYPDNRAAIMQVPGLIDVILDQASNIVSSDVVVQCIKVIESLLCDAHNRADYLMRPRCIGVLVKLCRSQNASACLYAVGALRQLSIEASMRQKVSGHEVLAALIRLVIIPAASVQIKLECLQTISNLICVRTAAHFMAYSGLLKELAKVATSNSSENVKALAARSIKRLSTHVHPRHDSHKELFEALNVMSFAQERLVRLWTARSLVEQSLLAGSSFLMVRTPIMMGIFIRLAASKYTDVKAATFEALANLSQEPANARRISMNDDILELLVHTIRVESNLESGSSRQAVRAVLLMASNRSSTKRIAKHLGLVSCLSRYGMSSDEDSELKQAALHGVVVLAHLI